MPVCWVCRRGSICRSRWLLRAAKNWGFFVWKQIQVGISGWVTKQGAGAQASPLSLGHACAIRTDHHKSPSCLNFPQTSKASCNFANFSSVDQLLKASTTRWRRVRTPRPLRSRVVPSRPLVCAFDPGFHFPSIAASAQRSTPIVSAHARKHHRPLSSSLSLLMSIVIMD